MSAPAREDEASPTRAYEYTIKRRLMVFAQNVVATIAYLSLGGLAMSLLESDLEDEQIAQKAQTLQELRTHYLAQNDTLRQQLEHLGCEFGDITKRWTFAGSTFYSLTVITTIGYGSYAPITYNGRSFTVIYGLLGISIVGQLLASCASVLAGIFKSTMWRARGGNNLLHNGIPVTTDNDAGPPPADPWEKAFEDQMHKTGSTCNCRLVDFTMSTDDLPELLSNVGVIDLHPAVLDHVLLTCDTQGTGRLTPPSAARALTMAFKLSSSVPDGISFRTFAVIVGAAAVWILMWGAVFLLFEGWTYRESLWFCFITMSTIGFGDFTPTTDSGRMFSFLFIVPGLGLGALALGAFWSAFNTQRFWCLQRAHNSGFISRKYLEASGVHVIVKTRLRNVTSEERRLDRERDYPPPPPPPPPQPPPPKFTNFSPESQHPLPPPSSMMHHPLLNYASSESVFSDLRQPLIDWDRASTPPLFVSTVLSDPSGRESPCRCYRI
eukprot:Sspe_Gene.48120::Locus_24820_Transcript_1_1_Confidence_1.000_Length_1706::g.48120::m.48120/K20007/KCNK18; potassium channel subfamily K member 18